MKVEISQEDYDQILKHISEPPEPTIALIQIIKKRNEAVAAGRLIYEDGLLVVKERCK